MLTKNAERSLGESLDAVVTFPEVLLLDTGSIDATLEIGGRYPNVQIHHSPFIGFGPLRNHLAGFAKNEWILALDSDEILSSALIDELNTLVLDPTCVYEIPRHNFYNGKQIKGSGWHPEWVVRLYHKKRTSYCSSQVHESVLTKGQTIVRLQSPLLHTPYLGTSDFLAKMQHYSTLFAKQHAGKKKASVFTAITHAFFAFFKSYFLKRGWLDGKEGFIISLYNGNTTFYKYLKLMEACRQKPTKHGECSSKTGEK